ncbi:MAG: chorismate mutase, partial [Moraxella sp.]|nr:chorismate mutase [Moraxella sp.]
MTMNTDDIKALREKIDNIDEQIQELINSRAKIAHEVAIVKKDNEDHPIFYRPEREAQVLKAVMARNTGPIADDKMARLFREIMSVCLELEAPQKIAFLGPIGTFTHAAALKHFGKAATTVPMPTINDVFREVESGAAAYGVVPVENSSEGVVNHTLDGFLASSLKIIGEVELPIHHNFLVAEHTRVNSLSRIYSHQQSLAQCRHWLDTHFPNVERVPVSSNGEAARRLKDEWHSAAIAGDVAVAEYGLHKLYENIEDNPNNTTRFLIIGREAVAPSGQDKTSIIVSSPDKAGALIE